MEGNLFTKEINLLEKQIESYTEEKNKYTNKKQYEIKELLNQIDNKTLEISSIKKKIR